MIQNLPITERKVINKLNLSYKTDAQFAFACIEHKEIKATCLYDIDNKTAIIKNVSTLDENIFKTILEGLFLELKNNKINKVVFSENISLDLLQKSDININDKRELRL